MERPLCLEQGRGAGREGDFFFEGSLLGLSWAEFQCQPAVRWNEAGLCGFLKRDPHDPTIPDWFFQNAKALAVHEFL